MRIKLTSQSRSNSNYICVSCKAAKKGFLGATCGLCGKEMHSIGKKRRVPKKSDKKGWDDIIAYVKQYAYNNDYLSSIKPKIKPKVLAGKSPRSEVIKLKEKSIKTKLKQDYHND